MPPMHAAHMAAPTPVAAPAHEPPHNDVIAQAAPPPILRTGPRHAAPAPAPTGAPLDVLVNGSGAFVGSLTAWGVHGLWMRWRQ